MITIVTHGHDRGHAKPRLLTTRMVGETCFSTRQHYIHPTGVYCSPMLSTAWAYARPQVVFGDGAYHRVILELRVSETQRKKKRAKGGEQWVFEPEHVRVHGVWVGDEHATEQWRRAAEPLGRGRRGCPTRSPAGPTLTC